MTRPFLSHPITDDSALGGSTIERSLRFDSGSSSYLEKINSSAGNRRTMTYSFWFKRVGFTFHTILRGKQGSSDRHGLDLTSNGGFRFWGNAYNASPLFHVQPSRLLRDLNAWYHLVLSIDTTQSTASDRVKIYINGDLLTDFDTSSYPSQNESLYLNDACRQTWGVEDGGINIYFADIHFINGYQYDPSYFGYTESQTGIWRPKRFTGTTAGTSSYHLKFNDNSGTTATTLGKDSSGNNNNFTPNNFATGDAVKDSPTNNFCIMNIHDNNLSEASPHFVYSEGNLKAAWSFTGTNFDRVHGSLLIEPHDTNKYYWEMIYEQNNESMMFGVCATDTTAYKANQRNTNPADSSESNIAYLRYQPYQNAPYILKTDASSSYHGSYLSVQGGANVVDGDVLGFVFDRSTGKLYVFHNGNELTNQNYSNNTSVFDTVATDKTYAISLIEGDGGSSTKLGYFIANFGQDSTFAGNKTAQGNTDANGLGDFYHSVPTGAKALCSANLPTTTPSIIRPQKHFKCITYTGDGSSDRDITGLEFKPDFVWIKNRQQSDWHMLQDSVRGANKVLYANESDGESTDNSNGHVNYFNKDGFNVTAGASGNVNQNTETYVAWCWKAGGAAVSNTDGNQTTQVSVNEKAGFSIVTYTGTGSNTNIGHGLGAAPNIVITKSRSTSGNWAILDTVGNSSAENGLFLNDNGGYSSHQGGTYWNDTLPTSTTFRVSSNAATNASGVTYVAYCWTSIPGYSKFGKYTGNGSTDGPFIFTGFRPSWVTVKKVNAGSNWLTWDSARESSNVMQRILEFNDASTTDNPYSNNNIDFLSNGFKLRTSFTRSNNNNDTYIYMAFAEQPGTTPYDTETNAR